MIGLEVSVNGKRLFVAGTGPAGIAPTGYLGATVACVGPAGDPSKQTLEVDARRIANDGTMDVEEWTTHGLTVGDEISIRIVEVNDCDPPTSRCPLSGST